MTHPRTLNVSMEAAPAASSTELAPISTAVRLINLCAVVIPFAGLIAAIALLWGKGFSVVDLALVISMYLITSVGITVGFHRLFTHRSFETNQVVQFALAVMGSMAVQGPLLRWVAVHRRHHQHSDGADDPHSPHHSGGGLVGVLRGFFHAHLGWMFKPGAADLTHYVKDLHRFRSIRVASALFPVWVILGLAIPTVLGGVLSGTWTGALFGLLWGGLVRVFLVHHVTWSINSVCHLWGRRTYENDDHSRNNFLFGVLGLGEGWHNNHHAFPTSARHGLKWWEIDVSYWIIRALGLVGLAWNIKVPAAHRLKAY